MPVSNEDMNEIISRMDERYVKKGDCDSRSADSVGKLQSMDKKLAVIEYRLNITNWLTLAIAGGIISLVIKIFLGG